MRNAKRRGVTITDLETYKDEENAPVLAEQTDIDQQRRTLFNEMLKKISESCQNILKLSWQGLKMDKVAEELNISYAYARKKKSECMAKLIHSIKTKPYLWTIKIYIKYERWNSTNNIQYLTNISKRN